MPAGCICQRVVVALTFAKRFELPGVEAIDAGTQLGQQKLLVFLSPFGAWPPADKALKLCEGSHLSAKRMEAADLALGIGWGVQDHTSAKPRNNYVETLWVRCVLDRNPRR